MHKLQELPLSVVIPPQGSIPSDPRGFCTSRHDLPEDKNTPALCIAMLTAPDLYAMRHIHHFFTEHRGFLTDMHGKLTSEGQNSTLDSTEFLLYSTRSVLDTEFFT